MKNFIEVGKTEEEQVEQIKQWIKENGWGIAIGLLVGFGGIFSWNYYQTYQQQQSVKARSVYLTLINNPEKSPTIKADLQANYPESSYVKYANLMLAKNAVKAKDYPKALDYLQPLLNDENTIIASITQLRASSIYLQTGDYERALSVLDNDTYNQEDEFEVLYNQLKGDIYLAQKNIVSAKEHYQLAIQKLDNDSRLKQLIQIKLSDLN